MMKTGPTSLLSIFYLFSHSLKARAQNDWSQPCFNGACSYDIARSDTSMAASLLISGEPSSISDITSAAGWSILNCTTNTNAQTIQLVCSDESKGCDHLFQQGAEDTVVRLPESCGQGPFARVSKHWTPNNQSLPTSAASKFRRSDGTIPQIHMLDIDANFSQPSSNGQIVQYSVIASTDPNLAGNSSVTSSSSSRRRSRNAHRHRALNDRSLHFPTLLNRLSGSGKSSKEVTFDKSFGIFNKTLECAGDAHENEELALGVGTDANVDLKIAVTVSASGSLFSSPHVTKFTATTNIIGNLDSGTITLLSQGLPGLSIPDIIAIGPQFQLNSRATATVELEMDLSVGIHYQLDGLSFTVGSTNSSTSGFTPLDAPVKFSVDPSVTAKATLEAHLIPTLSMGVTVLGKDIASLFLDLDTGIEVALNATAGADLSASTDGSATASESTEACVDVSSPISFNVGATGDLPGLSNSPTFPIFQKSFDIYQKCFGQQSKTTTLQKPSSTTEVTSTTQASTTITSATSLIENTVSAATITPTLSSILKPNTSSTTLAGNGSSSKVLLGESTSTTTLTAFLSGTQPARVNATSISHSPGGNVSQFSSYATPTVYSFHACIPVPNSNGSYSTNTVDPYASSCLSGQAYPTSTPEAYNSLVGRGYRAGGFYRPSVQSGLQDASSLLSGGGWIGAPRRVGYGGLQSWAQSIPQTRSFHRKTEEGWGLGALAKRSTFKCPPTSSASSLISESSDVPAPSESVERR
ncbi:hypothetical protein SCHPADRAFT_366949 [Schizopora paradoxa]|uniref:DUF7223 domain-containing protein n=1 Tax=Schizopora paradoxa TaxID=27342 RepID=A0A0H2RN96_9AGAM|nr:hypothetical protein SCHPADRAFT_366949 [Schizopora paradoxa]